MGIRGQGNRYQTSSPHNLGNKPDLAKSRYIINLDIYKSRIIPISKLIYYREFQITSFEEESLYYSSLVRYSLSLLVIIVQLYTNIYF